VRKFIIILLSLSLFGCAQMQIKQRVQEIDAQMRPLVGVATREMIADQFGIPARKSQLGTSEVWEYHQSFGSRSRSNANAYYNNPYNVYASGRGSQWEAYDRATLIFGKDGILKSYNGYVQR